MPLIVPAPGLPLLSRLVDAGEVGQLNRGERLEVHRLRGLSCLQVLQKLGVVAEFQFLGCSPPTMCISVAPAV